MVKAKGITPEPPACWEHFIQQVRDSSSLLVCNHGLQRFHPKWGEGKSIAQPSKRSNPFPYTWVRFSWIIDLRNTGTGLLSIGKRFLPRAGFLLFDFARAHGPDQGKPSCYPLLLSDGSRVPEPGSKVSCPRIVHSHRLVPALAEGGLGECGHAIPG